MQDVDVNGTPIEEQSKSRQAADQAAGAVSLLIKIGHKVQPQSLESGQSLTDNVFFGCRHGASSTLKSS